MIAFLTAHAAHYWDLFVHFASLSLLSVGGAIMLVPAMQAFLVDDMHWMNVTQFNASVSISQAAPGPNLLFVGLMGWYVGLGWLNTSMPQANWEAQLGVGVGSAWLALLGMVLPSTTLIYFAGRWARHQQDNLSLKAFKQGMAPLVIGLLIATGWTMGSVHGDWRLDWPAWLLTAFAALIAWRSNLHVLILLALGGGVGAVGWV